MIVICVYWFIYFWKRRTRRRRTSSFQREYNFARFFYPYQEVYKSMNLQEKGLFLTTYQNSLKNSRRPRSKSHAKRVKKVENEGGDLDEEKFLKPKKRVSFNSTIQTRRYVKTSIINSYDQEN